MKILVLCSSNVEGIYCEHALVEVDVAKKELILARREAFNRVRLDDDGLYTFEFWDGGAEFYEDLAPEEWLDDEGLSKLAADEWLVLPEGLEVPEKRAIRTDGDCLTVDEVGVFWSARDKYYDAHFETRRLPYQVLDACET